MELRKFNADTMRDALDLVRQELGEDAVIMESKVVRDNGTTDHIEVWAHPPGGSLPTPTPLTRETQQEIPLHHTLSSPVPSQTTLSQMVDDLPPVAPQQVNNRGVKKPGSELAATGEISILQGQLHAVHTQLAVLTESLHWLGVGSLGITGTKMTELTENIARSLVYSGGIHLSGQQTIVALAGPSGVGKTTLLAKIAWQYARKHPGKVAVITTDTLRIGGLEQIGIFCQHLNLPLEVVYFPEQMTEALARLEDYRLIVIDTPGGNMRDPGHRKLIERLLAAADPTELHLVLSAASSSTVLRDAISQFSSLNPSHAAFTMLDEARSTLEVFPMIFGSGYALSFLSTGPTVPTDLLVAAPENVAELLSRED